MDQTQQNPWRVLLLGAGGQLGQSLQQNLPSKVELCAYTRQDLDITQTSQLQKVIEKNKPQLIINTAAYTQVDQAEREPQAAYAVNTEAVAQLAAITALRKIPVLHISTDYVFGKESEEKQQKPYQEQDLPAPLNVYGESKLAGEKALLQTNPQALVVRTSSLFSNGSNNFVTHVLKQVLQKGKGGDIRVVQDQVSCPTAASDLALMLWHLGLLALKNGRAWQGKGMNGVIHYAGSEALSRYAWAKKIIDIALEEKLLIHSADNPVTITPCLMKDFPTLAQRPSYSVLCTDLVHRNFSIAPSNWQLACREMCQNLTG